MVRSYPQCWLVCALLSFFSSAHFTVAQEPAATAPASEIDQPH